MVEDILHHHFGPETGAPAPHITGVKIALTNVIESYGVTKLEVAECPIVEAEIVDDKASEGTAQ